MGSVFASAASCQAKLAESLQALRLRPGQKLYDYDGLPPGVALVAQGQMRLLAVDEQDVPFTLRRLGAGDSAGDVGLLRGVSGQALAASQPSQLWLIPQQAFLEVVREYPTLQLALAQPSLEELYAVAADSPAPRTPDRRSLRDWASNQLEEASDQQHVLLLPPGEHQFGSDWGPWLVSSSNISGAAPGKSCWDQPSSTFAVRCRRLLAKSSATPPMESPSVMVLSPDSGDIEPVEAEAELLEPDWQESSSAIVVVERQQDALEDWYGRLADDGSFLTSKGRALGIPMAVLRMLARQFDLPFRKDVLQRILEDQLNRNEAGAGISLLQMAAIADVMGLRASQLNVDDQQIARLQFPAITMGPQGPLILWDSDQGGQVLVGDPTAEQALRPIASLEERDEEGLLTVLCIERSQQHPQALYQLVLPALKQYKSVLIQVLLASFFVQLFGLLIPC